MGRFRLWVLVLALVVLVLAPAAAQAGSVWDPNEPGHVLDIRWVGVYEQADGRMRVTMSFHDPVRRRWFNTGRFDWLRAEVRLGAVKTESPPYFVGFFLNWRGRLSAWLCEGGSGCTSIVRATRPNAHTIRARVGLFDGYGPEPGYFFRGITREAAPEPPRPRPRNIDRTAWGTFT